MIVSLPEKTRSSEPLPPPPPVAGAGLLPDDAPAAPAPPADGGEEVYVFPATAAQRRFWLLDQLVPGGNPALNIPFAVRLTGRLDLGALERSFQEIVRRHEVLRTTFHCEKGQLRQIISPEMLLALPLVDVRDFPAAERAGVPAHLTAEEGQRPFDLAHGPVVRARLVRLSPEEHVLLVTVHHVVSDGWSNGVLLRELGELYGAFVQGKPSPLPELPIQFADFAQWQQDQAADPGFDDQLAYWRKTLAGELPVLDLPIDRPRRPIREQTPVGGRRQETLPPALAQSLKALAVRENVSAYMLYLAAFTVVLGRYCGGQEDILVHTPSANRDRREVEPLIGLFVNPLLLRADLSGDPTFGELLARTRRVVLGAFEHAGASFEKLIEELQPRRLQVDFLYQNNFLQPARLPGLDLVPLAGSGSATLAEWGAAVIEDGAQTRLSLSYNGDLFDAATIDRVLASYRTLLEAIAAPDGLRTALSRLPLETAAVPAGGIVLLADRWRLPTESVRWMDRCFAAPADAPGGEFGRSHPGESPLVLGCHLEPAPVGVTGEIYVRGLPAHVRQALPLSTWVEHSEHGPLLKTGDLARRRADGRIEWMGRVDQLVRVHGLRVDTARTEAALRAHPHITEAVVRWQDRRDGGGRRLVAFFQGDGAPPALFSHSQLRDFLRESLPEELIPSAFVPVERFPLTADGRLDAALLPDPAARTSQGAEEKYDAPYLTIHHQLIEIWRELLHAPSVGIRDDFFALGGNSLLAMRMLYRVEQACGKALLPSTLFQRATIEHLADEILRQGTGETAPAVIKICETGTKTPIFYLHGDMTGGGYYCMKLSRRLGPDQPFYALPPLNGAEIYDLPSIPDMAAMHLRTLRSVRPHGPYVVGGFCVGGLIAHELACQLEAQGESVERLLIIDATARTRRLEKFRRLAGHVGRWRGWNADQRLYHFSRWHFLAARLKRWVCLDAREQRDIFRHRLASGWERLRRQSKKPKTPPVAPANGAAVGGAWFDPRWDVPLLYLWAVAGFIPRPYAGRATLLLSRDLIGGAEGDPAREWKKYIPRLEWRELVGSHLACITEHADALAETIRACLEDQAG